MELILKSTLKRVKEKIVRDYYWYDFHKKQRFHGRGGKMIFVYDHINKKQIPRIIDVEHWVSKSNYEDILNWIQHNSDIINSIISKALNHYVAIDINANTFLMIEDVLRERGIQYDYDTSQLQQEIGSKKIWQNSQSKWPIRLPH